MAVKIDIDDKAVKQALSDLAARLTDMKPVLREIGELVRTSVERNFKAQGRPVPWKPSKRSTSGKGGMTLTDTARLRRSFAVEVSDDRVAVGTSVVYAGVHQFGAKKGSFGLKAVAVRAHRRVTGSDVRAHTRRVSLPWGNIPARPFLMIHPEDETAILKLIAKKMEL